MVAWGWLIVVFFFGFVGGMFLTALMKANDPYDSDKVVINPPCFESPDDWNVIVKNEHGEMIKYDIYGVAVYDPETGKWTSLN